MIKVSCPICGQAMEVQDLAEWPNFPFCSRRCKQVDLGRWLNESYGIAADDPGDATSSDEADLR